jgi:lysophospholipase L1-like esterase
VPSDTPVLDFALHWVLFAVLAVAAFTFVRRARRAATRGRLVLGNVLVLVALLSAAFAAGETYLRYAYDQSSWHAEALTTRAWLWRHCKLNSDGFREKELVPEKAPGVTRTVALGDSFTFGYGVADPADRFTDRLASALEKREPGRHEILNLGAIGANTASEIATLRQVLAALQVDRVIVAYSPNDVEDLLPLDRQQVAPFEGAAPGSLRSRSYLLDHLVMRSSLLDPDYAKGFFDAVDAIHRDETSFAPQAQRIAQLARLCRDAGLRLDVVVWPLVSHWGPDYPYDGWHERIATAWSAAGVSVVDLRSTFAGTTSEDLRVNALDAHPNERAHALVADDLLRRLY